jgi:hypothetical protein
MGVLFTEHALCVFASSFCALCVKLISHAKGAKEDAKAQRIAAFVPLCGIDYNAKSFSLLPHLTRGNLQNWRTNSLT